MVEKPNSNWNLGVGMNIAAADSLFPPRLHSYFKTRQRTGNIRQTVEQLLGERILFHCLFLPEIAQLLMAC